MTKKVEPGSEAETVERLRQWAARAKPSSEFVYFVTPPGHGEYDNPRKVFAAARKLSDQGDVVLLQRRQPCVSIKPGAGPHTGHNNGAYETAYVAQKVTLRGLRWLKLIARRFA